MKDEKGKAHFFANQKPNINGVSATNIPSSSKNSSIIDTLLSDDNSILAKNFSRLA